jgi:hypothetical protein
MLLITDNCVNIVVVYIKFFKQLLHFTCQIEDLQLTISRMEKDHGRREDILRQEVSDLQQVRKWR